LLALFMAFHARLEVFVQLTQGVVADVQGLVDLVRVGLQASLVAAAAEQVVVHLAGLPVVVVVAFLAAGVVVGTGGQNGVEARVEGDLATSYCCSAA
jgi:hypothetical protein